jgi:hypothetical protein
MAEESDVAALGSWKDRLRLGWQARWIITVAGAVAMTIIAGILIWNVITAEHPLAQLMPSMMQTALHPPR